MLIHVQIPVLKVTGHQQESNMLFWHHQIIFPNQFHATLRDTAGHQIDMFHEMLVDKLLLGGASVILD